MQAVEFLDSLIVHKNMRDDVWIELKWNPEIEQMWRKFVLSQGDIQTIHTEMEKIKNHLMGGGYDTEMYYQQDIREGKGELWFGWDYVMYVNSVDGVFDQIKHLLELHHA